jgi:hypothetical protein
MGRVRWWAPLLLIAALLAGWWAAVPDRPVVPAPAAVCVFDGPPGAVSCYHGFGSPQASTDTPAAPM